jgi:hypothetical protein
MKALLAFAATLSMLAQASAANAPSYSGKYLVTVTQSQFFNGNHCLTVQDDGSVGRPHSGPVAIDNQYTGAFQVIGNLFMVSIALPGQNGELTSFDLAAVTQDGAVDKGVYQTAYGGPPMDSGRAVFRKGGC